MTNLTFKINTTNKVKAKNYLQSKLKSLAFKHPIILKSDITIELYDSIPEKKQCTIKLKTQMSNFVVTSHASILTNAINESMIILNYQLTIMT